MRPSYSATISLVPRLIMLHGMCIFSNRSAHICSPISPVATAVNFCCRILPLGNNHKLLDHILNIVHVHAQQLFVIYFRNGGNVCNIFGAAVQSFDFFPQLIISSMVRPQPIHLTRSLSRTHIPTHGLLVISERPKTRCKPFSPIWNLVKPAAIFCLCGHF